jgi:hypothetical protein
MAPVTPLTDGWERRRPVRRLGGLIRLSRSADFSPGRKVPFDTKRCPEPRSGADSVVLRPRSSVVSGAKRPQV